MPFQIIRNDITKVRADAVVNTANPRPIIGSGTDSAIYEAAGKEQLLAERRKIGDISPGCAVSTPAFNLPAKFIIHTVGPVWVDGKHGEEALLRKAYNAALNLADQLGCKSVAFPLMAAGSYGFPRETALSISIAACTDFLMDHDMDVFLVLFSGKAVSLASSLFADLRSYIDDNYVEEQTQKEYGSLKEQRRRMGNLARPEIREAHRESISFGSAMEEWEVADDEVLPASTSSTVSAAGLKELLGQSEKTFSEYLMDLLRERSGKDSEVYKRAEVSKQLFSKILSDRDYHPNKSTVVQLAIGLQLDVNQTQKLLEKAGYTLTRSSKADLVVQYYIEHRVYNVAFINAALDDCALPLLKTGLKA